MSLNPFTWIKDAVGAIASPISKGYQANQARKQAKETGQAKLALAKEDNGYKLDMTTAEWEALSKQNEGETWKDEYITIVITMPFVGQFIGAVASVLTADIKYIEAANAGTASIQSLGIDYGLLLTAVVYAAIGIKSLRSFK